MTYTNFLTQYWYFTIDNPLKEDEWLKSDIGKKRQSKVLVMAMM